MDSESCGTQQFPSSKLDEDMDSHFLEPRVDGDINRLSMISYPSLPGSIDEPMDLESCETDLEKPIKQTMSQQSPTDMPPSSTAHNTFQPSASSAWKTVTSEGKSSSLAVA